MIMVAGTELQHIDIKSENTSMNAHPELALGQIYPRISLRIHQTAEHSLTAYFHKEKILRFGGPCWT
ncbi:MAG: hypothetical protein RSB25_19625 [Acinetobacter sp.]